MALSDSPLALIPFVGFGAVCFGMRLPEVEAVLGALETNTHPEFGDLDAEVTSESITLCFGADSDFRLDSMIFWNPRYRLMGDLYTGLRKEEFLSRLKAHVGEHMGPFNRYDDIDVDSLLVDSLGASFWIASGHLEHITLYPRYDASGNQPLWPEPKRTP